MRPALFSLGILLVAAGANGEVYHGVAVAPDGMNAWVVTIETTAVYHTTDLGLSWQPESIATFRDFFDVFFLDELNGWTCGRIGDIWHTTDGGSNWIRQNLGGPKFATRIRFFDQNYGWASGGEAILLRTTNGGADWDQIFFPNPPYPPDTVDFQGLSFVSPSTGWLAAGRFPEAGDTFAYGQGYIAKTADSCATWTLQLIDTVYDFFDVAFADADNGWVVGGNDRTMNAVVLRTTNGGASWAEQPVPAGAKFLRAAAFVGNQGWACGRNGTIIRTSDAGVHWELQPTNVDTTLFDIEFADTLRGMAAGNSVVLYTIDGGNTWVRGLGGIAEPCRTPGLNRGRLRVLGNPCRSLVQFAVGMDKGPRELVVYDASGCRVRTLAARVPRVFWDGATDNGRRAVPGVYVARLETRFGADVAKFTLLPSAR